MAVLVLLNGPPASGKSTIAARLVNRRRLALNLDIDVVRGQLGRWLDDTMASGRAARALAVSMARTHLTASHDVIVPQFLARHGFAAELASAAGGCNAAFLEIALMVDRETARSSFAARSREPSHGTHRDAAAMVERSSTPDPIGDMFDRWCEYLDSRPEVLRVEAPRGDIDGTVRRIEDLVAHATTGSP